MIDRSELKILKRAQKLIANDDSRTHIYKSGRLTITEKRFKIYFTDGHRLAVYLRDICSLKPDDYKVDFEGIKDGVKAFKGTLYQEKGLLFFKTDRGQESLSVPETEMDYIKNEPYEFISASKRDSLIQINEQEFISSWSINGSELPNWRQLTGDFSKIFKGPASTLHGELIKNAMADKPEEAWDNIASFYINSIDPQFCRMSGELLIYNLKLSDNSSKFKINPTYLSDALSCIPEQHGSMINFRLEKNRLFIKHSFGLHLIMLKN